MGILRYILSVLVLLSHMGVGFLGYNPGVVAVVVFYLLSGFVVQTLLQAQPSARHRQWRFYHDRSWRIFPLYLAALALAILLWLAGVESAFVSAEPGLLSWVSNLSIIPLNFYMYSGVNHFTLVPPAWSLGAELQFYLLAPALFLLPARPATWLAGLSGCIFVLAQAGILHTDHFGYRLLPGVLFIFMLGMHCARLELTQRLSSPHLVIPWLGAGLYSIWLFSMDIHRPFDREVSLGLVLGLPLVAFLPGVRIEGRFKIINRLAGNTAYGVFLLHFPMIWVAERLTLESLSITFVVVSSTVLALAGHHFIERPLWARYRKKLYC